VVKLDFDKPILWKRSESIQLNKSWHRLWLHRKQNWHDVKSRGIASRCSRYDFWRATDLEGDPRPIDIPILSWYWCQLVFNWVSCKFTFQFQETRSCSGREITYWGTGGEESCWVSQVWKIGWFTSEAARLFYLKLLFFIGASFFSPLFILIKARFISSLVPPFLPFPCTFLFHPLLSQSSTPPPFPCYVSLPVRSFRSWLTICVRGLQGFSVDLGFVLKSSGIVGGLESFCK